MRAIRALASAALAALERDLEQERGAPPDTLSRAYPPTVRAQDVSCDRQTEPRPSGPARDKGLEDPLANFGPKAGTVVFDPDPDHVHAHAGYPLDADRDLTAVASGLDGVLGDADQRGLKQCTVRSEELKAARGMGVKVDTGLAARGSELGLYLGQ